MYDLPSTHSEAIKPETFVETALRTGRAVVVGHGIVGHQIVFELYSAGRRAFSPIQILWIADAHDSSIASFGASGWHMPFLNGDPRIAAWAQRSFERWQMLSELGLADFVERTGSVFLSRDHHVQLPRGYPGKAAIANPIDFSAPLYNRAVLLDAGSVISACTLMPRLYRMISRFPGVTPLVRHIRDLADLLDIAAEFSAEVACVAAGDRAQFLLDDKRIEGNFGLVLLVDLAKVPAPFDRIVLMDKDRDHELTYSIPHRACGHVCLGGTAGRLITESDEYADLEHGLEDLTRAPRYVIEAIHEIRDRLLERLPVFGPALADGENRYWYGLRPAAERAVGEWLPRSSTGDIGVLHLGGLGGSGFTVTPAFVEDGLSVRRPTQNIEAHLGRPTPAHSA
ncbi:FAD-dependent oxidoreductase [Nocardia sp. NPDC046473]|uniref:FAD-dependent oxidoreductase n=1 Tax=Nocardia sp. NPDC046473 TaxID=3155733 RepID=UPI00340E46BB